MRLGLFCLMRRNKIHGFTWADQDWIGLMIFKNFADQDRIGFNFCGSGLDSDWTISQSAHLCCTDANCVANTKINNGYLVFPMQKQQHSWHWSVKYFILRIRISKIFRSESPSGMCTKLHTVAANNNRGHAPQTLYYFLFVSNIYGCYSSRTSRSWWIAHSMQRQRRGCNITI